MVSDNPLGPGMLTGAITKQEDLPANDYRRGTPRFAADVFAANPAAAELVKEIAATHAAPGRVALAWLLGKVPGVVTIPGTLRPARLEEGVGACLDLPDDEVARLGTLTVVGQDEPVLGDNSSYGHASPPAR